jgi:hypothetical protein
VEVDVDVADVQLDAEVGVEVEVSMEEEGGWTRMPIRHECRLSIHLQYRWVEVNVDTNPPLPCHTGGAIPRIAHL